MDMNVYLGYAVSLIYIYVSGEFLYKGNIPMATAYFGWALANTAILLGTK